MTLTVLGMIPKESKYFLKIVVKLQGDQVGV